MKIGIITINDNNNFGNRLQNYALQSFIEKRNIKCMTIRNEAILNNKKDIVLGIIKNIYIKIMQKGKKSKRLNRFKEFNKNIKFTKFCMIPHTKIKTQYDYFFTGSDQVWNPTFGRLSDVDLLSFAKPEQRIAFSASFGISELPENCKEKTKKELEKFKAISVREIKGKEIVENLTGREDVQVLVDPTMLLTAEEWDKVAKKPKQLKKDKYILNYFLGELSETRKGEIERIAKENNCEVINILDKRNPFYETGPSEFLYLEKNAFLICTDSFHSSVFAILYNRPFVVFDREDSHKKMNSRLDTLLRRFKLENRWYKGTITKQQLQVNYGETYKVLEVERKKAEEFFEKAIEN